MDDGFSGAAIPADGSYRPTALHDPSTRYGGNPAAESSDGTRSLRGIPVAPGVTQGPATVLKQPSDAAAIAAGAIVVCPRLDRTLTGVFGNIGAVVAETGGITAAAATVAREAGIPVVSGTWGAVTAVKTGDIVRVDGTRGRIDIMSPA